MSDCCQEKSCELEGLAKEQGRILWIVLAINAVMFVVELTAGLLAHSLALTGDSLDMLGDTIAYGSSIYVLGRSQQLQAKSALLKGVIMFVSAVFVFARAVRQVFSPEMPQFGVMGAIGVLVLAANLLCFFLLWKHREDNLNMSSVWLCSRNDLIANTAVLVAAALVFLTGDSWPDLLVGLLVTVVFARSAGKVLRRSLKDLNAV